VPEITRLPSHVVAGTFIISFQLKNKDFPIMLVRVESASIGSLSDNAPNPRPVYGANVRGLMSFLLLLSLLAAAGCGDAEKRVPVFPVTGKVTYQGKPPVGAQIVLHLTNSSATPDAAPIGVVQDDGSFTFTVYDPGDGAPKGDYVATVEWFKLNKEMGGPGPNVIPKKYTDPKTSPIKVTVTGPGPTEIPPITIANN
jgi:hypothetical protein